MNQVGDARKVNVIINSKQSLKTTLAFVRKLGRISIILSI